MEHPRIVGVHVMPLTGSVETPRPSMVAELDNARCLVGLHRAASVDQIVDTVGPGPAIVALDGPLQLLNERGRRDLDELLAWLDVPVFPASRARYTQVFGGVRSEQVAAGLRTVPGIDLFEAVPDLMLRATAWRAHGAVANDLAGFRARWLQLRPDPFRAKGTGRARPAGVLAAARLIAHDIDLGGWAPALDPDDWRTIADAAAIDAILCADAAWHVHQGAAVVVRGVGSRVAIPAVAHLAERVQTNVDRLHREGRVLTVEQTVVA